MEITTFTEWCPYCEKENNFKYNGINKIYTCTYCGKALSPCSLCNPDTTNCNQCNTANKAEKLNNQRNYDKN